MTKTRVAALQMQGRLGDLNYNLDHIRELLDEAVHQKARVVAVPEFFTTPIVENPRLWAASLPTENPALDLLREYATDHNMLVGGSYLERRGHYRRPGVDARRALTGNARALLDSRARLALPVLLAAAELVWA